MSILKRLYNIAEMDPVLENSKTRKILWRDIYMLLAVAGFTVCMALIYWMYSKTNPDLNRLKSATSLRTDPRPFPEFRLTNHHGQGVSQQQLKDHWSFIFFGYTYCLDTCPLALATVDQLLEGHTKQSEPPAQGIFISVDPMRDTLQRLGEYVQYFNQGIIGLTGTDTELEALTRTLRVVYSVPAKRADEGYLVDHSAHIFLVAPNGSLLALLAPHENRAMLDDFRTLKTYYNAQQGS